MEAIAKAFYLEIFQKMLSIVNVDYLFMTPNSF